LRVHVREKVSHISILSPRNIPHFPVAESRRIATEVRRIATPHHRPKENSRFFGTIATLLA
jgi:hypothetical protein